MIAIILAMLAVVNVSNNSVTYACNGVTATYQVNFPYLASTDLVVTSTTAAGSATTLTPGTDWSVNFTSTSNTATLTLTNPAVKCPSGNALKISRNLLNTQPFSFKAQTTYNQALHEQAYDRAVMLVQQVDAKVSATDVKAYVDAAISATLTGGSVVQPVTWPLAGDAVTNAFSIPNATVSSPDLYLVTIDGVVQQPVLDYTINALGGQIVFAVPPAVNAAIAVRSTGYAKALSVGDSTSVLAAGSSVPRLLKDWLGDVANVLAFGADPTGVLNSSPALAACFVAAKTCFVPDPTVNYRLSTTVAIPADSKLIGENKRTTKLFHAFNGDMFTMADGAGLYNLYLDGSGGTGRGIVISGTDGRQVGEHVRALNFDGAVIDFTATTAGSQSFWTDMELTRTAAGTGTGRYAVTIQDAAQLSAVPRKFSEIETSGNCAFSFGGSNNTQISNSVLGDLAFSTNTRGLKLIGSRWLNQVSATIDGHNNSIVGCDVLPALTIAAGSDHIVIGPNSQNANAIVDSSASVNGTFVTSAPVTYAPVLTASTANPVIGNGVLRGEYSRNGSVIHVSVEYTVGSTDTFGTGTWRFSLPVTPPGQTGSPTVELGQGYCRQAAGATFEFIQPVVIPGTAFAVLQRAGAGGPQVTNAAPFAWATGDIVRFTIDYHL